MSIAGSLALLAALMSLIMVWGWLWQRRRRNAGIVDVLWTAGVGLGAVLMAVAGSGAALPRLLLAVLGGAWSARLAWHLWRRVSREPEDGRYRALRAHWQDSQRRFLLLFLGQALLVLLFALPFVAVTASPALPAPAAVLGVAVWVCSVLLESVADRQLAAFRAAPANSGLTCRAGLWRYSRHPNYFFEWLHWFTYVALAWGSPLWGLAWCGPVVMYVFLRWVSGVPFTEAQALRTRGADYLDYQRSTSTLFPWFPGTPRSRT